MTRETQEQQLAMKVCILESLERLLCKKLYSEVLISEIYTEAHISKTTFYRYFSTTLTETLQAKGVPITDEISYEIEFVTKGLGLLSRRWATEGMTMSAEEVSHIMANCIPAHLYMLVCPD